MPFGYLTAIFKTQRSKYLAVVISLTMQHYAMLAYTLLYTRFTRGKRLGVLFQAVLSSAGRRFKLLRHCSRSTRYPLPAFVTFRLANGMLEIP